MSADVCTSARTWTITVPWDPGDTAPNRRLHSFGRSRLAHKAREAGLVAWMLAGRPRTEKPIVIDVVAYRLKPLDDDAVTGGLKSVRDGICVAALVANDDMKRVRWGHVRVVHGPEYFNRQHCVLTITEEEPFTNP